MLYVMLPAYNEEKSLPKLLEAYYRTFRDREMDYRVVVVDDGSKDRTAEVARSFADRMSIEVIPHGVNKGLGAAMRTGFRHLAEVCAKDDFVVTMDADNTHDPALIPSMIEAASSGYDVVIASRYAAGGEEVGLSPHRKVLSRGASFILGTAFPMENVRDYTCGYRLYRGSLVKALHERFGDGLVTENSFVCMAEILVRSGYAGARVGEVGLVLRYDLKEGASKMKTLYTIWRYLRFILSEKRARPAGA
jgi:dolichol-phosphate mannosyltransferase